MAARTRRRFLLVLAVTVTAAAAVLLAGNTWLRTGDIALWLTGDAPALVRCSLDERAPRVAAALLAGSALALSGSLVQTTTRNALAEPGILGITGGAGLAAVVGVTRGGVGTTGLLILAVVGALGAFALVYLLAGRGGLHSDRIVLIGIGMWYGTTALSTYLLVLSNPWDTPRIFTWLSGTTYGRTWEQVLPVAVVLLLAVPLVLAVRRDLDLLALDDDAPRLAGIRLERVRLVVLAAAALLAATSVVAVGVVASSGSSPPTRPEPWSGPATPGPSPSPRASGPPCWQGPTPSAAPSSRPASSPPVSWWRRSGPRTSSTCSPAPGRDRNA